MPGRRALLRAAGLLGLSAGLTACAGGTMSTRARVVVVGGGFGGATAAKYLRLFSAGRIDVVLIEPGEAFISCPSSNLVLAGARTLEQLTVAYTQLERRHGVRLVRDRVVRIDAAARKLVLASGPELAWDKLIVSPGVDLQLDAIDGLRAARDAGSALQAWQAGAETATLRRQLQAMPDGGVFAIAIPELPYRCPSAPYERASVVASYFKRAKPRSKVIIADANDDITSKPDLFRRAWAESYPGMIEYRAQHQLSSVDGATRTLRFEVQDDLRADVLNVLPPMRAGKIALQSDLARLGGGWAEVDYLSFESTSHPGIHVIGDAVQSPSAMPKSGHIANNQAKVAAAAIVARLAGWDVEPQPMLINTCYSWVDTDRSMHVSSVYEYVAALRSYRPVAGAGGLSAAPSAQEARIAWQWAQAIWSDMLG